MSPARSMPWRMALSVSILILFVSWTIWYAVNHWDEFRVISEVKLPFVLALYAVFLSIMWVNGLSTFFVLQAYGLRLSTSIWLSLTMVTSLLNWIMPFRGGAGFRAAYLKSVHKFSFTDFLSTFSAIYLLYVAVHGAIGLLATLLLYLDDRSMPPLVTVFFLVVTAAACSVMFVPVSIPNFTRFPFRQLGNVVRGWATLRAQPRLLLYLLGTVAGFAFLTVLQYALAFSAFGIHMSTPSLLFYISARNLSMLISITPGSLGIAEGVTVYLGKALHYTAAEGLLVQALIRVVSLTSLALAFPIASKVLNTDAAHILGSRAIADESVK